jgi:hypothetical protein
MVEAKQFDDWNHSSSLIATLIKINSARGKSVDIQKIHPLARKFQRSKRRLTREESYRRLHEAIGISNAGNSNCTTDGTR